jgi:glycosyltransferase involved in cell wall biosynthesis
MMNTTSDMGIVVKFLCGYQSNIFCGVADYTSTLVMYLQEQGVSAEIISQEDWNLGSLVSLTAKILSAPAPDIIHVQYPTYAYGASIVPHLSTLFAKCPIVITFHELAHSHALRKLSSILFVLKGDALVFCSQEDRDYYRDKIPAFRPQSFTIPIASNIPVLNGTVVREEDVIVTFGQIRPRKGIEQFVELARLSQAEGRAYRFLVIGATLGRFQSYWEQLRADAQGLPIEWRLGVERAEVARAIAQAGAAYLPFPDGASERRGTLLAVLGNGVPTVTTHGRHTPSALDDCVIYADTPERALSRINQVLGDPPLRLRLARNASAYASRYSWPGIARQHVDVYRSVLAKRRGIAA